MMPAPKTPVLFVDAAFAESKLFELCRQHNVLVDHLDAGTQVNYRGAVVSAGETPGGTVGAPFALNALEADVCRALVTAHNALVAAVGVALGGEDPAVTAAGRIQAFGLELEGAVTIRRDFLHPVGAPVGGALLQVIQEEQAKLIEEVFADDATSPALVLSRLVTTAAEA
jgi:hypothetical protein